MTPHKFIASLSALLLAASGCSPKPGGTSVSERTENLRFLWSAEPGIDLTTGPAVAVRADYESTARAYYSEDLEAGYPGWKLAVQSLVSSQSTTSEPTPSYARDWPSLPRGSRFYGTSQYRIMSLTEQEDHTWKAVVCSFNSNVFAQYPDGKYRPIDPQWLHPDPNKGQHDDPLTDEELTKRGIALTVLTLRQNPQPQALPLPPQQGSALLPVADVFGYWEITEELGPMLSGHWVDPEYRKWNYCLDARPEPPEKQVQILRSVLDSPPSLPAPVPGWPASPEA